MSAQVIKLQSYKDYQSGLLTKEELLEGKTFYPETFRQENQGSYSVFDLFGWSEARRTKTEESLAPSDCEE